MGAVATAPTAFDAREFEEHRQSLFGLAYRMLGSAAEAEDVVQDAWLRYRDAAGVDNPRAYLSTIVSRLCIDRLRSARARRESYPGPWLPEPLVEPIETSPGPEEVAGGRELLSYASMVLLETLPPAERAVFVLSEAFDYSHREIASTLGVSEASSRQALHRARRHVAGRERRFTPTPEEQMRLTEAFVRATGAGDVQAIASLLAEDVVFTGDGGGKRASALNPIFGRDRVLRLILGVRRKERIDRTGLALVNGEPGVVAWTGRHLQYVGAFEWSEGRITELRVIRNPDKLARISPLFVSPTPPGGSAR